MPGVTPLADALTVTCTWFAGSASVVVSTAVVWPVRAMPVAGTGGLPAPVLVAMVSVVLLVNAAGVPFLAWKLTWIENWSPALTRT